MPVGVGYAIDAQGARHPNPFCLRDAVHAPHPLYPYHQSRETRSRDPITWTRDVQGDGLYRLDIDLNTGRVNRVTVVKSTGSAKLDAAVTGTFKLWAFRAGKWKEITIGTSVRKKWMGMRATS